MNRSDPSEPSPSSLEAAFDAQASSWDASARAPLGQLRCDLVLHYLAEHLDGRTAPLNVLDAGAGTGSYALPLAQQGHHLCLLDVSAQMLDLARENAAALDRTLLERLDFCQAPVAEAPGRFGLDHFDLVLCHTLLEYVPDPRAILQALGAVLKPGGLLSLLAVNPHSDALRWAWSKGDLVKAREALGQTHSSTTVFGVNRRVYQRSALREMLAEAGIEPAGEYGVRLFGDYLGPDKLVEPASRAQLWELEETAGRMSPFAQMGRYNLLVGVKPNEEKARHNAVPALPRQHT